MRCVTTGLTVVTIFVGIICAPCASFASDPDDIYWAAGFNTPGPSDHIFGTGLIEAELVFDGKLIVAGVINSVNADSAANLAMFDGVNWSPFLPGLYDTVYALCIYNGSLYASGAYVDGSSNLVGGVARWGGSQWITVGTSNAPVRTLTNFGGKLAVGGDFTHIGGIIAVKVALWNGVTWEPIGNGLSHHATLGQVWGLADFDTELLAVGLFDRTGSDTLKPNVARWNGIRWESMGNGLPAISFDVAIYNGIPIVAGATDSMVVAAFVGETWVPFGAPLWGAGYGGQNLTVIGSDLYATGVFSDAHGNPSWTSNIIRYNGSTWESLPLRELNTVYSIADYASRLWVGRWANDGSKWYLTGEGNGMLGAVTALAQYNGNLIAGDGFTWAGTTRADRTALFDGLTWSPLGTASPGFAAVDMVNFNGQLIACGYTMPTDNRGCVAAWDGSTWHDLDSTFHGYGEALEVYRNELYMCGYVQWHVGNPLGYMICKWNGSLWQSLTLPTTEHAYDLEVYDDKLVVGGTFNYVSSLKAHNIAAWNGISWSTLGAGIDSTGANSVVDIRVFNGRLMVAGSFSKVGGQSCHNFAAWDGTLWTPIPTSGYSEFGQSAVYGNLFVTTGGRFDGRQFNGLGAWDGHDWTMFGSGLTYGPIVKSILPMGDSLFIGGDFRNAGGNLSNCIAKWTKPPEHWFVSVVTEDGRAANPGVYSDTPVIAWSPSLASMQSACEIEVGTDDEWSMAEMWAPGAMNSADTSANYAGLVLSPGTRYYLRIRINDGAQWSPWHYTTFRTNAAPSIPEVLSPKDLAKSGALPTLWVKNAIDLERDAVTYEFQGFHDTDCVAGPGINLTGAVEGTDSTDGIISTPLSENCRYWWSVRAFDGHLYSAWSSPWAQFVVNGVNEPPSAISAVLPSEGTGGIIYDVHPTFQWTASYDPDPGDTVRYRLEIATDSSLNVKRTYDSLATEIMTSADSLHFGTHYWWRATAFDKTGLSSMTIVRDFWTWQLGDVDGSHGTDIGDLTALIDNLFVTFTPIVPRRIGDLTGDCNVDIGDLTALIDNLFVSFTPLKPGCE